MLFLTNLKEISFNYSSVSGAYTKAIEEERQFENTSARLISLTQKVGEETHNSRLWLFSCTNGTNYTYSIGFFLDNESMLSPKDHWAFCFFPTREVTGLKFILHAPFLLNDGREGIIAGEQHNKDMIKQLAELSADSLLFLRDKKLIDSDIINIIPYRESEFTDTKILFKPFYTEIKFKLQTEMLLPAADNYVLKNNAYWFQDKPIIDLFEDEHLRQLSENPNAQWVFRGLARNQTDGESENLKMPPYSKMYPKRQYLDECVFVSFEMDTLLRKINKILLKTSRINGCTSSMII